MISMHTASVKWNMNILEIGGLQPRICEDLFFFTTQESVCFLLLSFFVYIMVTMSIVTTQNIQSKNLRVLRLGSEIKAFEVQVSISKAL